MSIEANSQSVARIEITPPRRVNAGALLAISAYGFLVCVPIFVSVVLITGLRFGFWTFLIPLAAVALATFFLPTGFGNPRVTSLVRALQPVEGKDPDGFVVQLTLSPRLRSGLRAVIEDADDFGCLSITSTGLVYHGDSINLFLPFEQIKRVQCRNIGWRGFYLYNHRIALEVSGLPNVSALEFAERSSRVLPASRRETGKLFNLLSAGVASRNRT